MDTIPIRLGSSECVFVNGRPVLSHHARRLAKMPTNFSAHQGNACDRWRFQSSNAFCYYIEEDTIVLIKDCQIDERGQNTDQADIHQKAGWQLR